MTSNIASSSSLFLFINIAINEKNNDDETIDPIFANTLLMLANAIF